ncbi:MAG: hypothetical protein IKB01_05865 [Lachnospiraceae bacterium]|nr:hypothetical protein [Lachnospiraceae bacterium]
MEGIGKLLKKRENYLCQLKKEKEKALKNIPEGFLRICAGKRKPQYYWRTDPKDYNGIYIPEKDIKLARKLAQKDYDKKVLASAEKELEAIKRYQSAYPTTSVEQVYDNLHKERQKLICPIIETDEQYIYNWESVAYQGKGFDEMMPEIYTAKGERVRSKSEVIIADILKQEGIPYRYECPLQLKGWGKVYPDFTVLNVQARRELYWEHLGMMDDPNYVESVLQKLTLYQQNGIFQGKNLILTYETKKISINPKSVRLIIEEYLR